MKKITSLALALALALTLTGLRQEGQHRRKRRFQHPR